MIEQKNYHGESVLITDTVRGYRQWKIDNLDIISLSSKEPYKWSYGINISECNNLIDLFGRYYSGDRYHHSPEETCTCGFYASYLPMESYSRKDSVLGVVEASGKVIMGTRGFRAEKMRIVALGPVGTLGEYFDYEDQERDHPLLDQLGKLGISTYSSVGSMLGDHPQKDMSSLGIDLSTLYEDYRNKRRYRKSVVSQFDFNTQVMLYRHTYTPSQVGSILSNIIVGT